MAVRRWFITIALLANALISGLVLLLLLNDGGWGSSNLLSATESELLIIVALVAFDRLTLKVSLASNVVSPQTATVMVLDVSPGLKVSVPLVAV